MSLIKIITVFIACCSLYAYADESEINRAICNGNQICLQQMQLGQIDEKLTSTKQDLQMAADSLRLMTRYDGVWPKTDEARDWYQGKRGLVCAANRKARREIPQAQSTLENLRASQHPGIANRADLKLRNIQNDPLIKFYLTETPCQQAETHCQHFGCTEIIEGSLF